MYEKEKKLFEIFFLWKQFRFFSRGDFKIQELFYLVYLKKKLTLRQTKAIFEHGQTQFFFIDSLNRSKFNFCCVPFWEISFVCFLGLFLWFLFWFEWLLTNFATFLRQSLSICTMHRIWKDYFWDSNKILFHPKKEWKRKYLRMLLFCLKNLADYFLSLAWLFDRSDNTAKV